MTAGDAWRRLLAYAVERLGRAEVAKHLKTRVALLDAWMEGKDEPPTRALIALADLVYELQKTADKQR
jgi:hypothetical protein